MRYVTLPIIKRTIARYVEIHTQGEERSQWDLESLVEFVEAVWFHPDDISKDQ